MKNIIGTQCSCGGFFVVTTSDGVSCDSCGDTIIETSDITHLVSDENVKKVMASGGVIGDVTITCDCSGHYRSTVSESYYIVDGDSISKISNPTILESGDNKIGSVEIDGKILPYTCALNTIY